jgi:hypothetical protein
MGTEAIARNRKGPLRLETFELLQYTRKPMGSEELLIFILVVGAVFFFCLVLPIIVFGLNREEGDNSITTSSVEERIDADSKPARENTQKISDERVPFYLTERGKNQAVAKIAVRAHEDYVAFRYPGLRQTRWKRFKRWL